jgi:hypothetical protein
MNGIIGWSAQLSLLSLSLDSLGSGRLLQNQLGARRIRTRAEPCQIFLQGFLRLSKL